MRILVVDDDHFARLAFVYALKDTPHEVETAASGEEAVHRVGQHPYDLFFLDLKMPGMDGVETLRALRKCCPDAPVYIVTAYRDEFMKRLKEASAEGLRFEVAEKPLDGARIVAIVEGVLNGPTQA
jgi:CheY-like chemotaxis protein